MFKACYIPEVAVIVLLTAIALVGQSPLQFVMMNPGGALAGCPTPAKGSNIFCSVAGDTTNPAGYYVSNDGASYQGPLSKSQAFSFPASFACNVSAAIGSTSQTVTLSGCK
jgi:hypothetical protein